MLVENSHRFASLPGKRPKFRPRSSSLWEFAGSWRDSGRGQRGHLAPSGPKDFPPSYRLSLYQLAPEGLPARSLSLQSPPGSSFVLAHPLGPGRGCPHLHKPVAGVVEPGPSPARQRWGDPCTLSSFRQLWWGHSASRPRVGAGALFPGLAGSHPPVGGPLPAEASGVPCGPLSLQRAPPPPCPVLHIPATQPSSGEECEHPRPLLLCFPGAASALLEAGSGLSSLGPRRPVAPGKCVSAEFGEAQVTDINWPEAEQTLLSSCKAPPLSRGYRPCSQLCSRHLNAQKLSTPHPPLSKHGLLEHGGPRGMEALTGRPSAGGGGPVTAGAASETAQGSHRGLAPAPDSSEDWLSLLTPHLLLRLALWLSRPGPRTSAVCRGGPSMAEAAFVASGALWSVQALCLPTCLLPPGWPGPARPFCGFGAHRNQTLRALVHGKHVPGERVKLTCLHGLAQALRLLALAPSVSAALLVLTHSSLRVQVARSEHPLLPREPTVQTGPVPITPTLPLKHCSLQATGPASNSPGTGSQACACTLAVEMVTLTLTYTLKMWPREGAHIGSKRGHRGTEEPSLPGAGGKRRQGNTWVIRPFMIRLFASPPVGRPSVPASQDERAWPASLLPDVFITVARSPPGSRSGAECRSGQCIPVMVTQERAEKETLRALLLSRMGNEGHAGLQRLLYVERVTQQLGRHLPLEYPQRTVMREKQKADRWAAAPPAHRPEAPPGRGEGGGALGASCAGEAELDSGAGGPGGQSPRRRMLERRRLCT
ncbi:unnamed protein product [Rangifer tarandus platyrhynchus]|uniref:Uncharacterized protein n=2 Tax=Rangifer tarandus platyrhynchus TaxID=3082113 RepID=A0ABN8XQY2_RANTA|nr:unnamed protein product [Rangifer tarandus platyrhynchus]CAI9711214.1 unnamed protein product [Rangifer tarandus platyrhynchus]